MNDFLPKINTAFFDNLGKKLYGEKWPAVRAHNIKRLKGDDPSPLEQDDYNTIVNGLKKLDEFMRR
jgi:hypothetical protein